MISEEQSLSIYSSWLLLHHAHSLGSNEMTHHTPLHMQPTHHGAAEAPVGTRKLLVGEWGAGKGLAQAQPLDPPQEWKWKGQGLKLLLLLVWQQV